jgi:hypothetical protein
MHLRSLADAAIGRHRQTLCLFSGLLAMVLRMQSIPVISF